MVCPLTMKDPRCQEDGRWADRIDSLRHRLFVGRRAELDQIARFLDDPALRLLHVWGPGGIGKTTLLHEAARLATQQGLGVQRLDARTLSLVPSSVADALSGAADVLIVDEFQALAALEPWLREEVFPNLPSHRRVITARREALGTEWTADAAFRRLMVSVRLDVLSPGECAHYLEHCGIDQASWPDILSFAKGLPLALSLASQAPDSNVTSSDPQVIGTLLERLLRDVTVPARRRALEVAALNRVATPGLLADVLGEGHDVDALFDWLRQRSFVRITDDGVAVHDVLREVLIRDLVWRHEQRRRDIADRSLRHHLSHFGPGLPITYRSALRSAIEITETEFALARDAVGEPGLAADALRDTDCAPILEAIERDMGLQQRRHAERYMSIYRAGCLVGRGPDGSARAFLLTLELPSSQHDDDPAVVAFTRWFSDHTPLAQGEQALLCRFYLPIGPPRMQDSFLMLEMTLRLVATPGITVSASFQPESYHATHPEFAFHDLFARIESDGQAFTLLGHDLRKGTFAEASRQLAPLRLAYARGLRGGGSHAASMDPSLPREAFEAEVRRALKDFHRGDRLAKNPLRNARFLGAERGVEALRRSIERACTGLGSGGEDALHTKVLLATYIHDARKQLAVAHELGMAYSTLRKHLVRATRRVADVLWQAETAAPRTDDEIHRRDSSTV
jgi:hypothetical protein